LHCSDTGSHNRLDLIQSIVPPHYVCNGYVLFLNSTLDDMYVISLSNISIKTNFKQITRVELRFVQYSEEDYIMCMTSRNFFRSFTNVVPPHYVCNGYVLFLNSTLDDGRLYLATGTMPVSNDFPRELYLWHRCSRVTHIYFCQDLSPLE
jgi:hypothetical protein